MTEFEPFKTVPNSPTVTVDQTGAGVEWLTLVSEVPGSILSRGAFRYGLEQVTFPQLLNFDSVDSKKVRQGSSINAAIRYVFTMNCLSLS